MVESRRAGSVVAPSFSTEASMDDETPTSRSKVVMRTSPPRAWSSTLERIGSVVRVLTTFCTACNPARSFSLLTLNFILGNPRRNDALPHHTQPISDARPQWMVETGGLVHERHEKHEREEEGGTPKPERPTNGAN